MGSTKGNVVLTFENIEGNITARDFFQQACHQQEDRIYAHLSAGEHKQISVSYHEKTGGLGRAYIEFNGMKISVTGFLMEGTVVVYEKRGVIWEDKADY